MNYFRIRDRGSGYYLTTGAPPQFWRMIGDKRFAMVIEASDERDPAMLSGIAKVSEWFGENKANGFDLIPERVVIS